MDKQTQNAQNVISMTEYLPETGFAAVAQVEAYWEALRAGRLMPKRSDIDPRGLELALENSFILERIAAGIARLRVAGSHLNDLMGMEVRGMPLTTFFAPTHRKQVADALEDVFQRPASCTLTLTAASGVARPDLEAKVLLLPLKSDFGDVSRALGCLVTKGDIGLAPRRFDITHTQIEPLMQTDGPAPTLPVAPPAPGPEPAAKPAAFAEDAKPFEHMSKDQNKRPPYLRLIKSDRD